MHIQHYAIIFIVIILPFSIVCRAQINNKIDTINEETRINHALDTATFDAIDTIRDVNDEFYSMYEGQTVDITPRIAMEGIDTFFHTMSINYGLPFMSGDADKDFFSPYIPAILVIAYDGFYIYSVEKNASGYYTYTLSPKIPYTYEYKDANGGAWIINFSLGNYIGLIAPNDVYYQGEFTENYIGDAADRYNSIHVEHGDHTLEMIPRLDSDMSLMIYAMRNSGQAIFSSIPSFLNPPDGVGPSMLADYTHTRTDDSEVSEFHKLRREVIVSIITKTLNLKMNAHNRYADMMGINYDFFLPNIAHDDWINAIDDVAIMSFVQGIPIGPQEYYNSYALGSSRIVQTEYIYCTSQSSPSSMGEAGKIYHKKQCPCIYSGGEVDDSLIDVIYINREDAAKNGYYPCKVCNP